MKEITSYYGISDNGCGGFVKDNINKPISNKKTILKYLMTYHDDFTAVTCAAVDRITGKSLNGDSIKTYNDGVYCWTNEEEYLFEKYDLKLNDDFIDHVLNKANE